MELHQLQVKRGLKDKKRIGRGGKRGTYSGRGMKGQKSRAGARFEPIIRPLIKRYHKLKGAAYISSSSQVTESVNLMTLEKNYQAEEIVSPSSLKAKYLIHGYKKRLPKVKILSKGELSKSLHFEKCSFSEVAREKIIAAGGKISEEKIKRGKKGKKQLTPEQIKVRQEAARKQADKRKASKKKSSEKRRKEAQKNKDKKK